MEEQFMSLDWWNNPEIVITILVENGGSGDKIAVPIAKEVFGWYFENKEEKES